MCYVFGFFLEGRRGGKETFLFGFFLEGRRPKAEGRRGGKETFFSFARTRPSSRGTIFEEGQSP